MTVKRKGQKKGRGGLKKFFEDLDEIAKKTVNPQIFTSEHDPLDAAKVHELRTQFDQQELVMLYHLGFEHLDLLDVDSPEYESLSDDIFLVWLSIHVDDRP